MPRTKKYSKPATITFHCEKELKDKLKILAEKDGFYEISTYLVRILTKHVSNPDSEHQLRKGYKSTFNY